MDGVCQRWTKMDEDRQRTPKFLTARCVMWAHITAFGRLASGFLLAFGSTRALTRAGKEKAEAMPAGKLEESRDRNRPLKVFVSERERAEIETRAAATGLSDLPPISEISGLDFSRTRPWIRKPFWPS